MVLSYDQQSDPPRPLPESVVWYSTPRLPYLVRSLREMKRLGSTIISTELNDCLENQWHVICIKPPIHVDPEPNSDPIAEFVCDQRDGTGGECVFFRLQSTRDRLFDRVNSHIELPELVGGSIIRSAIELTEEDLFIGKENIFCLDIIITSYNQGNVTAHIAADSIETLYPYYALDGILLDLFTNSDESRHISRFFVKQNVR